MITIRNGELRYDMRKMVSTIILMLSLTGCTTKMPLRPDQSVELKPHESLAVFKMTLKNEFKNYLLTPDAISIEATEASGGKTYKYTFGAPERQVSDRELELIGSFALPPGDYKITGFTGRTDMGFAVLPVRGQFDPSFERSFSVGANDSVYLGHVIARLVRRNTNDEERAGPLIPLIDQATTGMSNGTFKFEVVDDFQKDTEYLKVRYPSVGNRTFRRALLTSGDSESSEVRITPANLVLTAPNPRTETAARQTTPTALSQSQSDNCTVSQSLEMKKLGLSDGQIKKSCSGAQ
jgi:hypothetical protein